MYAHWKLRKGIVTHPIHGRHSFKFYFCIVSHTKPFSQLYRRISHVRHVYFPKARFIYRHEIGKLARSCVKVIRNDIIYFIGVLLRCPRCNSELSPVAIGHGVLVNSKRTIDSKQCRSDPLFGCWVIFVCVRIRSEFERGRVRTFMGKFWCFQFWFNLNNVGIWIWQSFQKNFRMDRAKVTWAISAFVNLDVKINNIINYLKSCIDVM